MGHLGGLFLLFGPLSCFYVWGKMLELLVHACKIKELLILLWFCQWRDALSLQSSKPPASLNDECLLFIEVQ